MFNACFVGGSGSFLITGMYVSLFGYVWILESLPIWERAAEQVYHLSHLFTGVTSSSDFFSLVYCGLSLG